MFADFSLADGLGVIGSLVICSAYLAVSLGPVSYTHLTLPTIYSV